jgi:hypothetical protein
METRPGTTAVAEVRSEERNRDELELARLQARDARTALGRRLWETRASIVASGAPLRSWDEIDREVEERRGGPRRDEE